MAKKQYQLGSSARKIDPRLRVVANGTGPVNAVRAETCASLAIAPTMKVDLIRRTCAAAAVDGAKVAAAPPRGNVASPPADILCNVFIATDSLEKLPASMLKETGRVGSLATATVPLSKRPAIAARVSVRSIAAGRQLKDPDHLAERVKLVQDHAATHNHVKVEFLSQSSAPLQV